MKNVFKVLGIIAFAAVIGFSMAACGEDDDSLLNGVWKADDGVHVTVSGNKGVLSAFAPENPLWQSASTKGYIKKGSTIWKNLASDDDVVWSGEYLLVGFSSNSPNVATGTKWFDCTFTLSADGQTLTLRFTTPSGLKTETWER
jgi:hypothetical protein